MGAEEKTGRFPDFDPGQLRIEGAAAVIAGIPPSPKVKELVIGNPSARKPFLEGAREAQIALTQHPTSTASRT